MPTSAIDLVRGYRHPCRSSLGAAVDGGLARGRRIPAPVAVVRRPALRRRRPRADGCSFPATAAVTMIGLAASLLTDGEQIATVAGYRSWLQVGEGW